jgi:hypothetical protein
MSNLEDAIKSAGQMLGVQTDGILAIGSVIGTLSDLASGVGTITAVVNFVAGIIGGGKPDPTKQALQDILNAVQQLGKDFKAVDIKDDWNHFDDNINQALGNWTDLVNLVNNIPPGDTATREQVVLENQDAVQRFGELSAWTVVYDHTNYFLTPEPTYRAPTFPVGTLTWAFSSNLPAASGFAVTTVNYGGTTGSYQAYRCGGLTFAAMLQPQPNGDGLIFNYVYVLPYFMRTIMMYLAVGAALEPDTFVQTHASQIRSLCITQLQMYHDQIVDGDQTNPGIVNVLAPPLDCFATPSWDSKAPWAWMKTGSDYMTWDMPPGNYNIDGSFAQPFGAVSAYGGFAAVAGYPSLNPVPQDQRSYTRFFAKYLLRALAQRKAVYQGIGLPAVWNALQRMKALVGDAPLGTCPGDWSFKEIYDLVGVQAQGQQLIHTLSMRGLTAFLDNTPPTYSRSGPISLRQLLRGQPAGTPLS